VRGLSELFSGEHRRASLLAATFFVALFVVLAVSEILSLVTLRVGQVAPANIVAPRTVVNTPLYQRQKAKAAAAVAPVYIADPTALPGANSDIQATVRNVLAVQAALPRGATTNDAVALWGTQVGLTVPTSVIMAILKESPATITDLAQTAENIMASVMGGASYGPGQIPNEQSALDEEAAALALPARAQTLFLEAVLNAAARPNLSYSASQTQRARERAQAAVPQPMIEQGTVVVQAGQKLTADDVALLKDLGIDRGGFPWGPLLAAFILTALFTAATGIYLTRFRQGLVRDQPRLFTVVLLVLITVIVGRIVVGLSPLLVPLAFLATAGATLLGSRVAIFLTLTVGILLTVVLNLDPSATVMLVGGSLAGIFATGRLRSRSDLLRAPLGIGVVNLLLVFTAEILFTTQTAANVPWGDLPIALVSAAFSSVLTIGLLPFFETYVGVLSPLRLLELSDPNQPLLRKLMLEAAGSYHHSLIVSNLAVAAAEEIGADALLCRVGAYYHDIGKTVRPAFFVDNQMGGENPHDNIAPSLSALIIASHVKDGLAMAEDARLPGEIRAFIAEHHGTTVMSYFYTKAMEQAGSESVNEHDYRYPGPRPQSRETAILLLADGCEAAVRALKDHEPQKIEGVVRKMIKDRLDDGQLDQSALTLRDLDMIARAFVRVLVGVYHSRIEYPDPKEIMERRQVGHGRMARRSGQR